MAPVVGVPAPPKKKIVRCWHCRKKGHHSSECTLNQTSIKAPGKEKKEESLNYQTSIKAPGKEKKEESLKCWNCGCRGHNTTQCLEEKRSSVIQPDDASCPVADAKATLAEMPEVHGMHRKRQASPDKKDENKLSKYSRTSIESTEVKASSSQNRKVCSAEYFTVVDKTVDLILRDDVRRSRHHKTKENYNKSKSEVRVCVEKIMSKYTLLTDEVKIYNKYLEIYGKNTVRLDSVTQNASNQRKSGHSVANTNDDEIFKGPVGASAMAMCRIQSAIDTIVKNEINSNMTSHQITEFRISTKHGVFKSLMEKPVPQAKEIIDEYYNFLYRDYYESTLDGTDSSLKSDIEKMRAAANMIVRKNFLERAGKIMQDCVERRLFEMCVGKSITNSKLLIEEYEKKFGADNLPVIEPNECICKPSNRTYKPMEIIFDGPENASIKTLNAIMHSAKSLCASTVKGLTELQDMLMSWIIRDRIFTILNGHPVLKHKDLVNLYRSNFPETSDVTLIRKICNMKKGIESYSDLFKDNPDVNSSKIKTLESTENAMFREYIVHHHDIVEFHSLYLRWIIRIRIYDIANERLKSDASADLKDLIQMYQTKYPLVNDERLLQNCLLGRIEWNLWQQMRTFENDDSEEKNKKQVFCERIEKLLQEAVLTVTPSSSENSSCDVSLNQMLERKFKSMLPQLKEDLVKEYTEKPSVFQDTSISEPTVSADLNEEFCRNEIVDPCDPEIQTQDEFDKILTDIDQDLSELIMAINEDG